MQYEIYFRTSRGGIGIPYELAKTEFIAVYRRFGLELKKDRRERHRMSIELPLIPDRVAALAGDLGFTEAIVGQHYEPFRGEEISAVRSGRWLLGWIRVGDYKVHQTEVYVQDKQALLADAPSNRQFEIVQNGDRRVVSGHNWHRAVSTLDARFLFNIADPKPTDVILDPFAGFGGLALEGRRRGLTVFVSDIDDSLSPGLSANFPNLYVVADARHLPIRTDHFDLIVTEPPFRSSCRQAVMDSLPELLRVMKHTGRLILLIAMDMCDRIHGQFEQMGAKVDVIGIIPRGARRKCPVLRITLG